MFWQINPRSPFKCRNTFQSKVQKLYKIIPIIIMNKHLAHWTVLKTPPLIANCGDECVCIPHKKSTNAKKWNSFGLKTHAAIHNYSGSTDCILIRKMFCVIDRSLTQVVESIFINSPFFEGNLHLTCKCGRLVEFSLTKL